MTIGFVTRRFFEHDILRFHRCIIAREIVGLQKEPDTPTTLIANRGALFRTNRLRQQKRRLGAIRPDADLALAVPKIGVLEQAEP